MTTPTRPLNPVVTRRSLVHIYEDSAFQRNVYQFVNEHTRRTIGSILVLNIYSGKMNDSLLH